MEQKNNNFAIGMTVISAIFFIFGFVTSLNNILIPKLQEVFDLSNAMAQLVNFAFFFTYFIFSIPSGSIIKRTGYKNAIIIGLILIGIGSFLFYPAASSLSYPLFLFAIFILAIGVVFLQTAANPYVAALGSSATASGRLNLVQAINSIAVTLAPMIGSILFFKNVADNLDKVTQAQSVQMPFVVTAVITLLIAVIVKFIKLPVLLNNTDATVVRKSVWKHPHVILGAFAIFAYVGAEVSCASFIKQYIGELNIDMLPQMAANFVAIYWGGAMIGRFFGSIMLSDIKASKRLSLSALVLVFAFIAGYVITRDINLAVIFLVISVVNYLLMQLGRNKTNRTLAVFAIIAGTLIVVSVASAGMIAVWAVCAIGFFNSVMFPNIFALAVTDLDNAEMSTASGIINTLIVGGAVIPLIMGAVADASTIQSAYLVPLVCYLYILFYAVKGAAIR